MNPEHENIINAIKNTQLITELKERYLCSNPRYPPCINEDDEDDDNKVVTRELNGEGVHNNSIYLLENYLISTDVYDVSLLLKFFEGHDRYSPSFNFIFKIINKNDNNKYYCLITSYIGSCSTLHRDEFHSILLDNAERYFMTRNLDEIIDLYKFKKTTDCLTYRECYDRCDTDQIDIAILLKD
jgi:hypothetical protein